MKYLKKITRIFIIFILLFCFTGCFVKADNLQKIRLCEVTHSIFYAPQYVAISEGFFKEEGLYVELSNGGGADKVVSAILSNNIDIGLAGPEASIYAYDEKKEDCMKIFAQITKKDGSFLISKECVSNFSWKDLKGKTVMPGRRGGVPFMTFEYLLKQNGLIPEVDVKLNDSVQFDLMAGAFSSGQADYVTLFEPTASTIIRANKGYFAASIGEELGEIPYTVYFAKQSYTNSHLNIIQKFTRAITKSQKWLQENSSEEVAKSIESQFADIDIESLKTIINRYKEIDVWNKNPIVNIDSLSKLQDIIIDAKELTNKISLEAIVDNSYAENSIN